MRCIQSYIRFKVGTVFDRVDDNFGSHHVRKLFIVSEVNAPRLIVSEWFYAAVVGDGQYKGDFEEEVRDANQPARTECLQK